MPITTDHLGSCDFCGHRLWPVDGVVTEHEGEHYIELECSQRPDPEQCTKREFKISEIFGDRKDGS